MERSPGTRLVVISIGPDGLDGLVIAFPQRMVRVFNHEWTDLRRQLNYAVNHLYLGSAKRLA